MPYYRWTGADAFDGTVAPGDVVELRAAVGDPQPEMVRVEAPADSGGDSDSGTDPPVDPGDFSVADLRDHLRDSDYDEAVLAALYVAEAAGADRTTALDAIDAAR